MKNDAYQKAWRELHPHYQRDWMRRTRGAKPRILRNSPIKTRNILGVIVRVNWLEEIMSPKAVAEREFLTLTKDME